MSDIIARLARGRMSVQQIVVLKPAKVRAALPDLSPAEVTELRAAARDLVAAVQRGIDEAPKRDKEAMEAEKVTLSARLVAVEAELVEIGKRAAPAAKEK